jgi:polysaccharide pyruvyl transferase CsaB
MIEIVISGYYGFGNAGDEAMLAAMVEAFGDLDPNVKLTVLSGNPADTRRRHGVEAVYRLNVPAIVRVLARSQLLISGGGSLLQDVTSDRSLYYYLSIMLLAKKMGKPVMLYAQGVGPVRGAVAKAATRYAGNQVDLITVRDEGSRDELKYLQITKPPVTVTADPVLALHPVDREIGRHILRRNGLEGAAPLVGISVREWRDWTYYKGVLAAAADRVVAELGARVVFIPMQCPDDVTVACKIVNRMKQPAAILQEEYTTTELLSLVGNLDMLIGIRLHALIFSAVMRTSLVGISYDPKIDRFLKTLGDRHVGTLQTVTVDSLLAKVQTLWPDLSRPGKSWEANINALRDKAFYNAELALGLISDQTLR